MKKMLGFVIAYAGLFLAGQLGSIPGEYIVAGRACLFVALLVKFFAQRKESWELRKCKR